jgi:membrane-anchored protein YejM (alkaline phosphatase superfamily)
VLSALETSGAINNTIVVIIGDHGEAFGELGYFGHNGTFSRYQTQTLCVMHVPGQASQKIDRLTSHYDIPATILENMGCATAFEQYGNGISMFSDVDRERIILASWSKAAILIDNHYVVTGYRQGDMRFTVYDFDWKELEDPDAFMRTHPGVFQYLLDSSHAFRR